MPKFGALAYLWLSEWNDETGVYALRQAAAAGPDLVGKLLRHAVG
jgi:hypothetical protein